MPICFVIQPFDGGKFDRRYDDTFRPAIKEIGLEAYRVDQDPAVEVLIDEIERKIRDATVCLADISTDNPNVWYELGYAFALRKKVLIVCSEEREGPFPFDIQHRAVVRYRTGSGSDYEELGGKIVKRMKSLLARKEEEEVAQVTKEGQQEGKLSDLEVQVLGLAVETQPVPGVAMPIQELQGVVTGCGISGVGFGLALKRLREREFLEQGLLASVSTRNKRSLVDAIDEMLEESVTLTQACWDWIDVNAHLFSLDEHGTLKDI